MIKYEYTPEFLGLRNIINKIDPIGLISLHCPDDEYDPEVNEILKIIPDSRSVQQLADMIHSVFIKWFDPQLAKNYEDYHRIAELIWETRK